jgi:hypothetical protein
MLDEDNDDGSEKLSRQALSFFMHVLIALGAWIALMMIGYAVNTPVSQMVIFALSILFPLIAGFFVVRMKPDEMAGHVWLAGLIWLLVICLWILDMPTGPNACYQCSATEKLSRTLFSIPRPSGLIDDNGPVYGTWPAAALFGYAIGARLALRQHKANQD